MTGTIYTETVVYSAPEAFVKDAPYQVAIVALEGGGRLTARILGEKVSIGEPVELRETRDGIPYFQRVSSI